MEVSVSLVDINYEIYPGVEMMTNPFMFMDKDTLERKKEGIGNLIVFYMFGETISHA